MDHLQLQLLNAIITTWLLIQVWQVLPPEVFNQRQNFYDQRKNWGYIFCISMHFLFLLYPISSSLVQFTQDYKLQPNRISFLQVVINRRKRFYNW